MRQTDLPFDVAEPKGDGLAAWRQARAKELEALARRIGLPVGHRTEVWLKGGVRLRGTLRLASLELLVPDGRETELRLEVDRVTFQQVEMESCVRID